MNRSKSAMLATALLLAVSSTAAADTSTPTVGTSYNWYFGDWCPNSSAFMYGIWGYVYNAASQVWLAAGLCNTGGSTPARGTGPAGYGGVPGPGTQRNSVCNPNYRVNGLAGYYTSAGINDLWPRCLHTSLGEYDAYWQPLTYNNGGTYASVRCSGNDYAVGVTGSERPRLLRIGLICRYRR